MRPDVDRWESVVRWIGRIWAEAAIVGYLLWQASVPSPVRGEGDYWERLASLAVVVVIAIGHVVTWRWEEQGAIVMAVGGALLALLTFFRVETYEAAVTQGEARQRALFILFAFSVPAFLYWLIWRRGRPHREVVAVVAMLMGLVAGTTAITMIILNVAYGPVHPSSSLTALPDAPVVWVWAGPPSSTSTSVVARIRDPGATAQLALATDEEMTDPVITEAVSRAQDDPAVVRFEVDGLIPGTRYYYAVSVDGQLVDERSGTLTTAPQGATDLTIAIGACIQTGSNGSVFDQIRAERPDLFIFSGDFGYEDFWTDDRSLIRRMYDTQLTAPAIDALVREVPVAYVWDDHDFGPNDADSTAASAPAAQIVYRQSAPYLALPAGPGPEAIYQSFEMGRVRFILTDGRSERSPKAAPDNSDKTMLGAAQLRWLAAELQAAAQAGQVVVLSTNVPWNGSAAPGADDWAGYSTERTVIADLIADSGVADQLVMVAGDAHMVAIDDGSNTDFSSSRSGGFPLLHPAALDRNGSAKGGPYSEGAFPGGGQYGLLSVTDDGGDVTVGLSGRDYTGAELVGYTFTIPAAALVPAER